MKVKELIAKLQEFDGELEVLVDGYEGGCDEPSFVEKIKIKRDFNKESGCYGKHAELNEWDEKEDGDFAEWIEQGGVISEAILIER